MAVEEFANLVRHKKCLRAPLKLAKAILSTAKRSQEDINVLCLLLLFFAKYNMTSSNPWLTIADSNKEYFAVKGGIRLIAHSFKAPDLASSPAGIMTAVTLGTAAVSGKGCLLPSSCKQD